MADNLPPVVGRLVGDTSDFSRKMQGARGDLRGFDADVGKSSSALGGMAKTAALAGGAFAAIGVGSVFKDAIMGASDLAETVSKVNVVFEQSSKEVIDWSNGLAKAFGLPKRAMLDAASSFGLVAQASGLSAGESSKMSMQLGKLAADASSFYNVPLPEALESIRSGLVGEAEPMRKFGVLLSEAAVQEKAFAMGIAERGAELTEAQKVQARSTLIMEGMSKASGDLERTQGSLANRMRELKGRWENFITSVGEKALPAVLGAMDGLEKFGGAVSRAVGPALEEAKGGLRAFWFAFNNPEEGVSSGGFAGQLEQLGADLRPKWEALKTGVSEAFGGIATWLSENEGTWRGWAEKIGGIVTQMVEIQRGVWTLLATIIGTFVNIAMAFWDRFGNHLWQHIQTAFNAVVQIISGALQIIKGIIDFFIAVFQGDWGAAWDAIKEIVSGVWNIIQGIVKFAINYVSTVIGAGMALISQIWSAAWNAIKTFLSDIWETLKNIVSEAIDGVVSFVSELPGKILRAIGNLGELLYNAGKAVIEGLLNGIKDAVGGVFDFVGGIGGKIASLKGPLDKDRQLLVPAGKAIMGGLVSGLRSGEGGLISQIGHTNSLIGGIGPAGTGGGGGVAVGRHLQPITVVVKLGDAEIARVADIVRDEMKRQGETVPNYI